MNKCLSCSVSTLQHISNITVVSMKGYVREKGLEPQAENINFQFDEQQRCAESKLIC